MSFPQIKRPPKPYSKYLDFRGYVGTDANDNPFTLSIDVGPAGSKLVIVAHFEASGASSGRTLDSATIDGSASTIHLTQAGDYQGVGISSLAITTGGSIDVVSTWSGGLVRGGIAVWVARGYASSTPHATDFANDVKTSLDCSPEISGGGFGIYACASPGTAGAPVWATPNAVRSTVSQESNAYFSVADHRVVSTASPTINVTDTSIYCSATWS